MTFSRQQSQILARKAGMLAIFVGFSPEKAKC
jgi:hypothetical protein